MKSLFQNNYDDIKPLSYRLRPKKLEDFIGQENLIGKNRILSKMIESGKISNMILYGPPGCGKTSLGEIISNELDANIVTLNATIASLNDLRDIVKRAKNDVELYGKKTILFLDEIHRFNKTQQDALLSYTESGVLTLIGATTESPYHNLNNALLSRCLIFEFKPLTRDDIKRIIERGENYYKDKITDDIKEIILDISNGDSRIALNYVELYFQNLKENSNEDVKDIFSERKNSFHKADDKYNIISAMIKSIRGSDPDAALYWLGRLLHGGEDPRYVARRIFIHASEDIGMANPEALLIAHAAYTATEKIGMPEVRIILAEAVIYLSISTKSNSCYNGINEVFSDLENRKFIEVPEHLKDSGRGYIYPHDYPNNFVNQVYLPGHKKYYHPGNNRYENQIRNKIETLWKDRK